MVETDWSIVQSLLVVVCAACALISAVVCLVILRKVRTGDLGKVIADGDAHVKEHAERMWGEIRTEIDAVRGVISRIETYQAADEKHILRARDLTPLHEKINDVAIKVAETRSQATAENRALAEQMKVLQGLMQNLLSSQNGRT